MAVLKLLLNILLACPIIVSSTPIASFPWLSTLTQHFTQNRPTILMKTYSGKRLSNDTLLMIYYYESTIAVTELGPQKLLLGCELIEIYDDNQGQTLLKDLMRYNRPLEIDFNAMIKLMKQCELVEKVSKREEKTEADISRQVTATVFPRNPVSLLSGILPGTKWCGTGDIAATYHDLGVEQNIDRCCRQHDLCPIKLRNNQSKYNLQNSSPYTKSHCVCDDIFFGCLKNTNTTSSQLMGYVYFNIVAMPCLQQTNNKYQYRAAKTGF